MENTIDNKAKFFAQYYGQTAYDKDFDSNVKIGTNIHSWGLLHPDGGTSLWGSLSILLKPLSSISDEDAIEVSKYEEWNFEKGGYYQEIKNMVINSIEYRRVATNIGTYQYLQSKGYALPFHEVSVDQQIEYGWVKLIEPTA